MNKVGKKFVYYLSSLVPSLIVKFAYAKLTSPQVSKLRPHELEVLDQAKQSDLDFKGFTIRLYEWAGGGDQSVLLVHGWEGQAGNFADLVEKLLAANYTVYAFDGPSHGFSSKGSASLFEFTELVGLMVEKFQVDKIVSHSFGGVATTFALFQHQSYHISRYALLTTPNRFTERIDQVAKIVGIAPIAVRMLTEKIERAYDIKADDLNVSDFVKEIKVDKALIIHDRDDKIIPISQSRAVAQGWEVCTHEEITGTGHFRILRTESVLDRVVTFLES